MLARIGQKIGTNVGQKVCGKGPAKKCKREDAECSAVVHRNMEPKKESAGAAIFALFCFALHVTLKVQTAFTFVCVCACAFIENITTTQ